MKTCNCCGKEKDTHLKGKISIDDEVRSVIICSDCICNMTSTLTAKYRKEEPPANNQWEAWETPAYDSD